MQSALSPGLLPRNLPGELVEFLTPATTSETSLVDLLSRNPMLLVRFFIFAGQDQDWRRANPHISGWVMLESKKVTESLSKLISTVESVSQNILAEENPHKRRAKLCESFLVMVISRRVVYDYEALYRDLAELRIPHEIKIAALMESFDNWKETIKTRGADIAPGLDTSKFFTISQNAQEAYQKLQEKNQANVQINAALVDPHLSMLWNKLVGYMEQFQNGDIEFLGRDLKMLGLPDFLLKAAETLKRIKNKSAPEFEAYKEQFAEYETTVREKFYLYTALSTLCPPKTPTTTRVSAPISMDSRSRWNEPTTSIDDPQEVWKTLIAYIKERRPNKFEKIMKTLAPLPLPIHFKIIAICPDFDKMTESLSQPLYELFCKNFRNLTNIEKSSILRGIDQARRDSTEHLTSSPPLTFLLSSPHNSSLLPASNSSAAAAAAGSILAGNPRHGIDHTSLNLQSSPPGSTGESKDPE